MHTTTKLKSLTSLSNNTVKMSKVASKSAAKSGPSYQVSRVAQRIGGAASLKVPETKGARFALRNAI